MNVAALTEKYGDLRQALLTIADDFGDSFLGKLARLLASKAEKLNVVVKFTTETGHGPAATFQAGSNHITIHAGRHRNLGDLHVSILHEAIHAYVSRTLAAAAEGLVKPKSAEYIFASFAGRILSVDVAVMERWALLEATTGRSGRRLPVMDGLLAASALTHGLTLATRNTTDFAAAGVALFDPWAGG